MKVILPVLFFLRFDFGVICIGLYSVVFSKFLRNKGRNLKNYIF